jgi:hypothetical protein
MTFEPDVRRRRFSGWQAPGTIHTCCTDWFAIRHLGRWQRDVLRAAFWHTEECGSPTT